jgi:hypothetical protein
VVRLTCHCYEVYLTVSVAPTCVDSIKNQDETDIDCGGDTCTKCADHQSCGMDNDCVSLHCVDSTCCAYLVTDYIDLNLCLVSASCLDGIKNQDETDIDCGGDTCTQCADNTSCEGNNDCSSLHCSSSVCSK